MKFRSIGLEMAKRGYVSMAMEYRLSGESHFPQIFMTVMPQSGISVPMPKSITWIRIVLVW